MEKQYDDVIDLKAVLLEWKKGWWMIAAAMAAGVVAAVLFSKVVLSPVYQSSSMLYVLSKETTLTSLADLLGNGMSSAICEIIRIPQVLQHQGAHTGNVGRSH